MSRQDKAVDYKHSGFNCAQAVLMAFSDILDEDELTLKKLGAGFGCGMGAFDATCGSLCAAQMILGLKCYSGRPMLADAKLLHADFKRMCGSADCGELKGLKGGPMLCACDDCIKNAVKLTEERMI